MLGFGVGLLSPNWVFKNDSHFVVYRIYVYVLVF